MYIKSGGDSLTTKALVRGWSVVMRVPLLVVLPLLMDLLYLGAAYLGAPVLGPARIQLMGSPDFSTGFRAFLPSPLPTVADYQLPMAPMLQPSLHQVPLWLTLITLIGLPVIAGLVSAVYLGAMGEALTGRPLTRQSLGKRALVAVPALILLRLVVQLIILLPPPLAGLLAVVLWSMFALVPLLIGFKGVSLRRAFQEAPVELWGHLGQWFSLGLGTFLVTILATFLISLSAPFQVVTMLMVSPWLGTWLVASAGALLLADELPDQPLTAPAGWKWVWVSCMLIGVMASMGRIWVDSWVGYQPSREAALRAAVGTVSVHDVEPLPGGELIVYRMGPTVVGMASLRRGRFGWQVVVHQEVPGPMDHHYPGFCHFMEMDTSFNRKPPEMVAACEVFNPTVAFIDLVAKRYPVDPSGWLVVIHPSKSESGGEPLFLDAQGQTVQKQEAKP
jgi:hypothetical protein